MFCTSFNIHNQRQYLDLIFRSLLLLNSFNIASLSLYCVFSRTLGDAPSAITYYEESAEFLSKLPTKDLEVVFSFSIAACNNIRITICWFSFYIHLQLVHTLSVSLNKIGDLRYYDGDLQSARNYYARSLDVRRTAVKEHSAIASQVCYGVFILFEMLDNMGQERCCLALQMFDAHAHKSIVKSV